VEFRFIGKVYAVSRAGADPHPRLRIPSRCGDESHFHQDLGRLNCSKNWASNLPVSPVKSTDSKYPRVNSISMKDQDNN